MDAHERTGRFYSATYSGQVLAFDLDGGVVWTHTVGLTYTGDQARAMAVRVSADGDKLYIGGNDDQVSELDTADGSVTWVTEYPDGNNIVELAVGTDGLVYLANTGSPSKRGVRCLDPDGTELWAVTGSTPHSIDVALDGSFVYVSYGTTVVQYANDGTEGWTYTDPSGGWAYVVVDVDGWVWIGTNEGVVRRIDPTDGSLVETIYEDAEAYVIDSLDVASDGGPLFFGTTPPSGEPGRAHELSMGGDLGWEIQTNSWVGVETGRPTPWTPPEREIGSRPRGRVTRFKP